MNDLMLRSLAQQRAADLRVEVRQARSRRRRHPEPDQATLVRCLVRTYAAVPALRSAWRR